MADIPTIEPASITAGSTAKWTKQLADYSPADGWVLSYSLFNASNQYDVTAADNGDGTFLVTISSTASSGYAPGDYSWQSFVTKGAERFDVECGDMVVHADPASGAVDGRSHVKKTLDAINATIEGRATSAQLSYSVDGVSVSKMSLEELIAAKSQYEQWWREEQTANRLAKGLGNPGSIRVRI